MQHAVQAAEQLVRPVHRAPDIRGLGDVSGEDFHLGAQCDDLDEAGHPAPDAVLDGAFAGDDAGPLLARRQAPAAEQHQPGTAVAGQVLGHAESDPAQAAGDQVDAVLAQYGAGFGRRRRRSRLVAA